MLDWELVPVQCGKCLKHIVGNYVLSSSFKSLIGETLIDLTDGVERVSPGPNRMLEKKLRLATYIA